MPASSMRAAQRMFAASSKRAFSSTTTATCLPLRAARTRLSMTLVSLDVRYKRHLDGTHLRVARGLFQKTLDGRTERFVGMLQQDRTALADQVKDIGAGAQRAGWSKG